MQYRKFMRNDLDLVNNSIKIMSKCPFLCLAIILFPIYAPYLIIRLILVKFIFKIFTKANIIELKNPINGLKNIIIGSKNSIIGLKIHISGLKNSIIGVKIHINGLKNRSAECYMNSIIQLLASSDTFKEQLDNLKYVLNTSDPKLDSLIDLLNSLNNPNSNIDDNSTKLESLIKMIGWQKLSQQDSYELLSAILNTIYKDIKTHKNSNQILMPLKLEMMHTFSGINIPSRTQFHIGLSIGLCGEYYKYPGVTLNYLIEQYFAATIIDDDQNKTSNILFLREPPNLLLLHIQANKWSSEKGEMVKPEYHIQYEKDLKFDAKCYIDGKSKSVSVQYKLTAIVHHMGTISGGHYITYRTWKGQWYLTNDEQVSLVDFNCNVCPYILLYEKS